MNVLACKFWGASQCKYEILYLIWCCGKWSDNFGMYSGCHDYSNKRVENQAQFGGPLNWAQAVLLMSLTMSPAISIAMSPAILAPLSTSLTCQQPCYWPCHHCYPRHCQVNSHVILHVINVWHGNWICDENYTICDVYFCHRKWVWVGLWGPGDILWRF